MTDTPAAAITFQELIQYTNGETARCHQWLAANSDALDLAWGDERLPTVRHLVQHVFAVERRSADRLGGDEATASRRKTVRHASDGFRRAHQRDRWQLERQASRGA